MSILDISLQEAQELREQYELPLYLYCEKTLREQGEKTLAFPNAFGLTVRYAMKAAPTRALLQLMDRLGLHFDASSGYEVQRLILAGIAPDKISLSTQEIPANIGSILDLGVKVNATSLSQIEVIGQERPGSRIGLRFNPGLGSGGTNRTNVGGPASSFGIWNAYMDDAKESLARHQLTADRLHSHIGSGSDPEVWKRAADLTLRIAGEFDSVQSVNLGGGYKIGRMPDEADTDLQKIGVPVKQLFEEFAQHHGRKLHLEIEPGTFLTANAGAILAEIQDIADTGPDGYRFYKLNSGMTDILRPSLYGSQHPICILTHADNAPVIPTLVAGHCCESGDILTPAPDDPELLQPRSLPDAQRGDFCLIGGTGAYCSSMSAKNYNAFPESAEVLIREDRNFICIRNRQSLDQIVENEQNLED